MYVHELAASGHQGQIVADAADAMIAMFEGRPEYVIMRWWDAVSYTVSIRAADSEWPFLSYAVGLDDAAWYGTAE
jgi:hypothetical protein